ncbi:MAG TPA: hypothetical protein VJ866_23400 [Pyrinomonadaceae bacterium]|nr:hypothetical protein [Pyrinomonadaceae bacterium]
MPSITFWNRLEPRPRGKDISESLAARLRDPLWLLARQWQFGEFQGEDAGSPAYVSVTSTSARPSSWGLPGTAGRRLPDGPLESVLTREELDGSDLSLVAELGQTFVALLEHFGASDAAASAFREAFPVAASALGDDPETASFRGVCAGRVVDGVALFRSASASPGALTSGVRLTPDDETAAIRALNQFVASVRNLHGELDGHDPIAWEPERLRYRAEIRGDEAGAPVLSATPDYEGTLDWYAFDLMGGTVGATSPRIATMIPTHASFRGMPNARFWDFEDARVDFGDVRPDRRDLSRLMLVEFMLLHANDWFVIPFEQDVGTLVKIDELVVHDVFGRATTIPRAGSADPPGAGRWSMFATTADGGASAFSDAFFLPSASAGARQAGDIVEEVRFLRDETADMVWAVEHTITNRLGVPRPGHEAALEGHPDLPPPPEDDGSHLRYRIQTTVPRNWVPFVPVQLDTSSGQIALELAGMLGVTGTRTVNPPEPAGRLLKPIAARGRPYRLREEEVPRTGVRIARRPSLCRWSDGATYLWWSRQRSAGTGEGSSGLRFDVVEAE